MLIGYHPRLLYARAMGVYGDGVLLVKSGR